MGNWNGFGVVDEEVQYDDVGIVLVALRKIVLDLLNRIIIPNRSIDHFGLDTAIRLQAFDELRKRLVEFRSPADSERITERHDAQLAGGLLI